MNTSLNSHAKSQAPSISKTDQKRLKRLATSAGRTPQSMLRFVLRDGFAACEEDVATSRLADREIELGVSVTHVNVMQAAKKRFNVA